MSVAIGMNAAGLGKVVDVDIASRSERQTDAACAVRDGATEILSQGLAHGPGQSRTSLDRLLDTPGPLDRFAAANDSKHDGNSA